MPEPFVVIQLQGAVPALPSQEPRYESPRAAIWQSPSFVGIRSSSKPGDGVDVKWWRGMKHHKMSAKLSLSVRRFFISIQVINYACCFEQRVSLGVMIYPSLRRGDPGQPFTNCWTDFYLPRHTNVTENIKWNDEAHFAVWHELTGGVNNSSRRKTGIKWLHIQSRWNIWDSDTKCKQRRASDPTTWR